MTSNAHQPVDFFNMPPSVEQQILATLLRIEVLLTPPKISATGLGAIPATQTPAPKKPFGRK
jgi:hypothetical protein